jgi:hypothetical protein
MITIRKVERYTVLRQTTHASVDPEKFRGISRPYEGSTDKEFIDYINEVLQEFYDDEDLWNELDQETQESIGGLVEPEYEEFHNTAWDGEDSFLQSGESTEDGHGFIVDETTERESRW